LGCAQRGKVQNPASNGSFGSGEIRGEAAANCRGFPHSPNSPRNAHCVHSAAPQNVDKRRGFSSFLERKEAKELYIFIWQVKQKRNSLFASFSAEKEEFP